MIENINFFKKNTHFKLENRKGLRKWISDIVLSEKCVIDEVNFVFCDDKYLEELNSKYLNHNTLTDILTFPFNVDNENVRGDIYISVQRVSENALKYKVGLENELHRVMIHGILHLLGYRDATKKEKVNMRCKENFCLSFLNNTKV